MTIEQLEKLKAEGKIRDYTIVGGRNAGKTALSKELTAKRTAKDPEPANSPGKGWSKGLKLAEDNCICIVCGKGFHIPPSQKQRGPNSGRFCSKECSRKFRLEREKNYRRQWRLKNPAPKKQEIRIPKVLPAKAHKPCINCGNPVKSAKNKYCSKECRKQYKIKNSAPKKKKINCLNCGKEIEVLISQVKAGYGKFCSFSCSSIHRIKQTPEKQYGNSKGGRRPDLDNRYFRSCWEANYARYLNFLIKAGEIVKWEYEPETFFFEGIRSGTVSYTPDFKLYPKRGEPYFVEVKGYMDDKSRIKLKRMAKFYPAIRVDLLDGDRYRAIARVFKRILPNWETNSKSTK